jgi:hypothetical protein
MGDEKLNDLIEKKNYVEKQNGVNSDKIKTLEERNEANNMALRKRDSEIDEINAKLKSKTEEYDKLLSEIENMKLQLVIFTYSLLTTIYIQIRCIFKKNSFLFIPFLSPCGIIFFDSLQFQELVQR